MDSTMDQEVLDAALTLIHSRQHTSPKRLGELRRGAPLYHTVRPDVLKLSRSTEDALTGICWQDDSANCVLTASKLYSDRPGCQITITQLK